MISNLSQAVKYLEKYIPTPDKKHPGELGLERMKNLVDLLGNPQLKYPTIHVGGTSGKGSTATFIASILATKYKVGLHTSPHLVDITERIKILNHIKNQKSKIKNTYQKSNIRTDKFVELLNSVIPVISAVGKSKFGAPSYFEIVAAIAFLYFYKQKVDIAVVEVGMGGRYDATNVIKPLVAVITNVGLDHTEILGNTVEKIAEDKAGIIKPAIKVVSGVKQKSVIGIINARMQECKNARISLLVSPPSGESRSSSCHPRGVFEAFSYRIRKLDSEGSVFDYKRDNILKELKIRLLGEHQVENAAVAIRTIELLNNAPQPPLTLRGGVGELNIRQGLESAFIPGRLEIIRRNPLVVLDGAHNPDKVKALVAAIKKIFSKKEITSIIAIKNDKNATEMLRELLKISQRVIFTKFQLTADLGVISSYNPQELLRIAKKIYTSSERSESRSSSRQARTITKLEVIPNPRKAVEKAIKSAKPDDLILITGSLYLVGEIRKFLISNY